MALIIPVAEVANGPAGRLLLQARHPEDGDVPTIHGGVSGIAAAPRARRPWIGRAAVEAAVRGPAWLNGSVLPAEVGRGGEACARPSERTVFAARHVRYARRSG